MSFTTIWPERRTLSAHQVHVAYEDAVANGDIEADPDCTDVVERAKALSDVGHYTFAKGSW